MSQENLHSGRDKRIESFHGFDEIFGSATKSIHFTYSPQEHTEIGCPVVPPICLSTTFLQKEVGVYKYDYSRGNNFTREVLEKTLCQLEKGTHCKTFSSGLAASNALIQCLKSGDHILCCDDLYGGTSRLFRTIVSKYGIEATFEDMTDADLDFGKLLKPNTRMVWLESPSNPLMKLVDIRKVASQVHDKRSDIIVVVDNTFMSPIFQNPLELGADVVLHSITKYINGHTDVLMGTVVTGLDELARQIEFIQFAVGAVPSPFDCYLVLRGMRTLTLRMREHMRSSLILADFLERHPRVSRVVHPGLKSHPQHELAKQQMKGYSGMIACYIDGDLEQTKKFISGLKLFALAESLGGFESLIEIPSIMTHASISKERRAELGILDNLVRMSVGLENVEDLQADLEQALASVQW